MEMEDLQISSTFKIFEPVTNGDCNRTYGSSELVLAAKKVANLLREAKNNLVLISLPKSASIVPVIFGVLESGNVFTYTSPSNIRLELKERESRKAWCLVSAIVNSDISTNIFGTPVFFTFFESNELPLLNNSKNCYVMQTSGTTGIPKEIIVPYSAIIPNVQDFCERFRIMTTDVISFSTELTFDPSVIELFIAAVVGCALLIIPDDKRVQPSQFGEILIKNAATFLQITPSALMLFPPDLLHELLGATSSLRILLLGGEAFPVSFLRRFYTSRSVTKVYNVYGLTEVSCWATCRDVSYETLMECDDIDIGNPIKDTLLQVSESNELLIRGRTCIIDGTFEEDWMSTGDLAKVDDQGKIHICGRVTNQIKLNGVRLNLSEIEAYVTKLDGVDSCAVVLYNNSLIMFIRSKLTVVESVKQCLPMKWRCHAIINIQQWPLTKHGKVDRPALLDYYKQSTEALKIDDVGKVLANFGIDIVNDGRVTFSELGFTSFNATELMLQIQHLVVDPEFSVVQYILSSDGTVEGLLRALGYSRCTASSLPSKTFNHSGNENVQLSVTDCSDRAILCWQENMERCIDATAVLSQNFIIIGSHSGRLVSLGLADGKLRWEKRLEGRIEGTVAVKYDTVVVGCYDRNIYFLREEDGDIFWKFTTGDIVKSTAKFIADGKCLAASHDRQLHLLDYKNRQVIWSTYCGGTIVANLAVYGNLIIAATLAGTILAIKMDTGCTMTECKCNQSFFASPCLIEHSLTTAMVVACDVQGTLYSLNATSSGLQQHDDYSATAGATVHVASVDDDDGDGVFHHWMAGKKNDDDDDGHHCCDGSPNR